jgi:hypothetical protein
MGLFLHIGAVSFFTLSHSREGQGRTEKERDGSMRPATRTRKVHGWAYHLQNLVMTTNEGISGLAEAVP